MPSLAAVLARSDIWRGDALPGLPAGTIPSGHPELDAELPGGGWPRGNLTEILIDRSGIGEIGLLLPVLARLSGEGGLLVLVAPPWLPHAPAWAAAGVAPERLLVIHPGKQGAWCIEQLLKSGGFAGLLAWPEAGIDARALRRLQVAAEGRPVFAALWRPASAAQTPSPAPPYIKGLLVSIDAMGCQKSIARQITDQGGDYLLMVKGNQPTLLAAVETAFLDAAPSAPIDRHQLAEKSHGRIVAQMASVLPAKGIVDIAEWPKGGRQPPQNPRLARPRRIPRQHPHNKAKPRRSRKNRSVIADEL